MKLAVGIITWQDGRHMLEQTIASLDDIQDELIVADGLIENIPTELGHVSDLDWLPTTEHTHVIQRFWTSQSAKRTYLLLKAKELGCEWLLQIDADERLHNAAFLKEWLPTWAGDAFPIPFEVDPGHLLGASWKCLRTAAWQRVTAGGAYLLHARGIEYCVVPPSGTGPAVDYLRSEEVGAWSLPWLSHHYDERIGERRLIRLGDLEHDLEPVPDVPYYAPPGLRPRRLLDSAPVSDVAAEATYYCDQCGAKYAGPGLCEQGHPPNQVTPLTAAPAADTADVETAETTADDETAETTDSAAPSSETGDTAVTTDSSTTDASPADVEAAAPPVAAPEDQPAPPAASPVEETNVAPSVAVAAGPLLAQARELLDRLAELIHKV